MAKNTRHSPWPQKALEYNSAMMSLYGMELERGWAGGQSGDDPV